MNKEKLKAAKDKIAQKYGYRDWNEFYSRATREEQTAVESAQLIEEAMDEIFEEL